MTEPRTLSEFVLNERWRFIAVVGAGADGTVYLAVDEKTGERVAIKVYDSLVGRDAASIGERIANEIGLRAQFESPYLVRNIAHGVDRGAGGRDAGYIVMEHLEGRPLRNHIDANGGRLRYTDALAITRQTAMALAALHAGSVAHLDLKPENIFLLNADCAARCGVTIKLLDLGAARRTDIVTASIQVRGTPTYAAPEICERLPVIGPQADVYGLGIMMYELLVGAPPLQPGTPAQLVAQHVFAQLLPLPAGQEWGGLAHVYARATARQPSERFADAAEMVAALDTLPDPSMLGTTALAGENRAISSLEALLPRATSTSSTLTRLTTPHQVRLSPTQGATPTTGSAVTIAPVKRRDDGSRG